MPPTTKRRPLLRETKDTVRRNGSKDQSYHEVIRELAERVVIKGLDLRWNRMLEEEDFIHPDEL